MITNYIHFLPAFQTIQLFLEGRKIGQKFLVSLRYASQIVHYFDFSKNAR